MKRVFFDNNWVKSSCMCGLEVSSRAACTQIVSLLGRSTALSSRSGTYAGNAFTQKVCITVEATMKGLHTLFQMGTC